MDLIINIAVFLIAAIIFTFVGMFLRKKTAESKMKSAESEAQRIIEMANKDAENRKKEEIFKAKEEIMNARKDLDAEIRERRGEVQVQEKRIMQKEENLEKKMDSLEKREKDLIRKGEELEGKKNEVLETLNKQIEELQRISGLSQEEAKQHLLSEVEKQLTAEKATLLREMQAKTKEEATKNAKEIIGYAIQKCAADHTSETTVSIVALPNEDMKGRIIGREGRNIKTLETLTGIDLIIDDTPEAVVISGFDPLRREVAKLALEKLIEDGRIHPAKIEEMVEKAKEEISMNIIANVLGLGNAATPLGLKAMKTMQKENKDKTTLSNSMAMFILINTASIQLIPTNVIAIRNSLNSTAPTQIIFPVWIATIVAAISSIMAAKVFIKMGK